MELFKRLLPLATLFALTAQANSFSEAELKNLSQSAAVYVGEDIQSTRVYLGGQMVGQESYDSRYGNKPQVLNTIVKQPLSEPFILAHPNKSKYVFLYFHGITDSAFQGKDIGRHVYEAGHNFMSARLAGHGIDSPNINNITVADWRNDVDRAILQASQLADHDVLIGLSTGGALIVDRVFRNPLGVHAVVPIAPAIGIKDETFNSLESWGLVYPLSYVKSWAGEASTTQMEVRQPRKGVHALHQLYLLGLSVQEYVKKARKLYMPFYIVTSEKDLAIQEERIPELTKSLVGPWQWKRFTGKDAPIHSGLVYSPLFVAHSFHPEAIIYEQGAMEPKDFAAFDEVNFQFRLMMDNVLSGILVAPNP